MITENSQGFPALLSIRAMIIRVIKGVADCIGLEDKPPLFRRLCHPFNHTVDVLVSPALTRQSGETLYSCIWSGSTDWPPVAGCSSGYVKLVHASARRCFFF